MSNALTVKILLFMFAGAVFGMVFNILAPGENSVVIFINNLLQFAGNTFLALIQMLVIPIVMVSIICGISSLERIDTLGRIGLKSFVWFLVVTLIAVIIAIVMAQFFNLCPIVHQNMPAVIAQAKTITPTLWGFIANIIPTNPFKAIVDGDMLQLMVFSILLGIAVNISGDSGRRIAGFFCDFNEILMRYVMLLMKAAPYGVFCLVAVLFSTQGFDVILTMLNYFLIVIFALIFQAFFTYTVILKLSKLSAGDFFRKVYPVSLFAFGVSSSAVSIPIMLETAEHRLGVKESVASFVIPFGVNFNKCGTAIMLTLATLYIAHVYNAPIELSGYFALAFMVVLVSMSTAAVPGIALFTLIIILRQFDLPIEGVSLIVGVDRLLDMVRTSVNATGNTMVACLVAKSEEKIDYRVYQSKN